jgi:hypothetical protein
LPWEHRSCNCRYRIPLRKVADGKPAQTLQTAIRKALRHNLDIAIRPVISVDGEQAVFFSRKECRYAYERRYNHMHGHVRLLEWAAAEVAACPPSRGVLAEPLQDFRRPAHDSQHWCGPDLGRCLVSLSQRFWNSWHGIIARQLGHTYDYYSSHSEYPLARVLVSAGI